MSWLGITTILLDSARTIMGLAVNWLIQSTLLIVGGLAVGYLLRRRGSAVQSALYRTTLVAALVCPLATWALSLLGVSGWSLQMPSAYSAATASSTDSATPASMPLAANKSDSASDIDARASIPTLPTSSELQLPPAIANKRSSQDAIQPPVVAETTPLPVPVSEPAVESTFDIHRFGLIATTAAALWFLTSIFLLGRLMFAWWQLHRLRRGARSAELPTIESCREIAAWLRVAPPEVLHSPYLPSPCLAGLRRPAVMLPETELCLPVRDVLVHELAHLRRNDCFWNVARQVATAVIFFQPLAWILSRRLAATAEEVCDDYVVQFGGDRHEYANRLVDIASTYVAPLATAGVGIISFRSMLAARVARILDTSRSLSTRVGHLLLALVLMTGLAATLLVGLVGLQSAPIAVDAEAAKSADPIADDKDKSNKPPESVKKQTNAEEITVHGQVVDPNGTAITNTDVYVLRWYWNHGDGQPLAKTKTDREGRFTISYRKSQFSEDSGRPDQWREAMVVAFADGYGFGWVSYGDLAPGQDAKLKLVVDDAPIEGRILDLEGKPVSGATIEVDYLNDPKNGNLDEWLTAVRARQSVQAAAKYLNGGVPLFSAQRWQGIKTDADGHFRLAGIGRERQLNIQVSGPTIVTSTLSVVTRDMQPIAQPAYSYPGAHDRVNYGSKFQYTAALSRPIEGIVRDSKTHDPIAGVEIWSSKFAGDNISGIATNKTKSDAKGHYRLEGMPKGAGNQIYVVPTGLPYFTCSLDAPDPPGIDPTPLDIELHRGKWVSGRVIDKMTKRGVPARMHYIVAPNNHLPATLPEFKYGQHAMLVQDRYRTKADGSYRVVALPGRGVIGVTAIDPTYPSGQGLESIQGVEDRDSFRTYNGVFAPTKKSPTAVKEIQIPADSDATVCDFELDSGRHITLRAVDHNGEPIKDLLAEGCRGVLDYHQKFAGPEFDVTALRDDEVRTVLVRQESRRLGKAMRLKPSDDAAGPIRVQLEPCATVVGKLVDGDGQPVRGVFLRIDVEGDGDYGRQLQSTATDADGRFRHDGFLPGLPYSIVAEGSKIEFVVVVKKLEVHPGETIDLGTIDITSKKRPEMMRTVAASSTDNQQTNAVPNANKDVAQYDGNVITPDGKPADHADIYLVFHIPQSSGLLTPTWKPVGTTDALGKFHFKIKPSDFGELARQDEWQYASIVAVKSGYGFGWSAAAFYESSGDPLRKMKARLAALPTDLANQVKHMLSGEGQPLKLVPDDVPLHGRVVDINGQPVAGARLTLLEIWTGPNNELAAWRKAATEPNADYYTARAKTSQSMNGPQVRSLVTPAVTDANGQFTLRGIGQGRIADLLLEGPRIETARLFARTEAGKTIELAREHRSPDLGTYRYYPAEFDYLAGPSKPIVGVVRDAETKAPLAGVTVKSQLRHGNRISGWGEDFVRAITGADGRYSLEGMPLGSDNSIAAIAPNDKPLFSSRKSAATKSNGPPLTIDFDLPRGVWVEGRITDKQSGKGLSGELLYVRHKDNPNSKQGRVGDVDERDRLQSDEDGRFRIVVSPGLGYLAFQAYDHENYPRADAVVTPDGQRRKVEPSTDSRYLPLANYHLVAEINPAADAKRFELNLQLDNGGILTGHVVGPDDKPLSDYLYMGRQGQLDSWRPARGDAFEVVGHHSDSPRKLYFAHREKNLAGTMILADKQPKNLVVKLQSAGKARGRLIDGDGVPLAHLQLVPWSPPIASPADTNREVTYIPLPPNSPVWQDGRYETDDNGQFELACLVPGVEYSLMAYDFRSMTPQTGRMPKVSGRLEKSIIVKPGQSLDLGDVRLTENSPVKKKSTNSAPNKSSATVEKPQSNPSPILTNAPTQLAVARNNEARQSDKKVVAQKTSGGVVGANGKPVAGAKIYWITWSMRGDQSPPQLVATTGQNGEFDFAMPEIKLTSSETVYRRQNYHVVVVAPGHGMAYLSAYELRPSDPVTAIAEAIRNGRPGKTITLPQDASIKGRVVNVDGQPVANVRVSIRGIAGSEASNDPSSRRDLEARGRDKQEIDWRLRLNELTHQFWPAQLPSIAPTAKTDADGNFELHSVGKDRIAQLLIEGDNIASAIIEVRSSPGKTLILAAAPNFGTEPDTLYATGFTHVAAPSKPLEGRVVDLDTAKPLAGAVVRTYAVHGERLSTSRGRQHLATLTDADGHYRITGLPSGGENRLVAFTVGDEPYVPIGAVIKMDGTTAIAQQDFKLKRGVWAQGRAYDAKTKKPLAGALEYYIIRNPDLERAVPGLRFVYIDEHYFTDADGRFRVPVLAARGILGFRYSPSNGMETAKYPRGVGADKISGGVGQGEMVYFETIPSYLMSSNFQAITEVAPKEGQASFDVDFALSSGRPVIVEAVDESGKPVTDLEVYGQNDHYGWEHSVNSKCKANGLEAGKNRELYFLQRSRNLVGSATVNTDTKDGLIVKLSPGGGIRGRLVNDEGEPLTGATLVQTLGDNPANAAVWPNHPQLHWSPGQIPVDAKGQFQIDGLIPGKNYTASVDVVQKMNGQMTDMSIGRVFTDVQIEPGKTLDLGDVRVSREQPKPAAKKSSTTRSSQSTGARENASPSKLGIRVSGRIIGSDGKPAAGAHVAAIGFAKRITRGGDLTPRNEILGETTSNSDGQYELKLPDASAKTHTSANLIASDDGAGVAWRSLDLGQKSTEASFILATEEVIRGRLADIEGKPAAHVKISIDSVLLTSNNGMPESGVHFETAHTDPAAWPPSVTTDENGKFAIHGIAARNGVFINTAETDRFAPQSLALNTGMPEQRGERDGTYRPQVVKNLKPGEEAVLALAPAQVIEGQVSYEDTGKPAPNARLTIWASQQKFGSMYSVAGQADIRGHYRISPYPGIRFGVTAYPPDGTAYLARGFPEFDWEGAAAHKQVDLKLPRGILVHGKVVDAGSGKPVAGASVQYIPESQNNPHFKDGILTGWQAIQISDNTGKFDIAILPGPGRLIAHGPQGEFVVKEFSSREISSGRLGGQRFYANAIERLDPPENASPVDLVVKLDRAEKLIGKLVDEKGKPVQDALVISRLNIHPLSLGWRGDASVESHDGRFEITGAAPGREYDVYFLDATHRLGAAAKLRSDSPSPSIVLKPCGQAVALFKDGDGEPLANFSPSLQLVVTPGTSSDDLVGSLAMKAGVPTADADFVANVDRKNYWPGPTTDEKGSVTLPALIPGARYQLLNPKKGPQELVVEARQTIDLGTIVVDQRR